MLMSASYNENGDICTYAVDSRAYVDQEVHIKVSDRDIFSQVLLWEAQGRFGRGPRADVEQHISKTLDEIAKEFVTDWNLDNKPEDQPKSDVGDKDKQSDLPVPKWMKDKQGHGKRLVPAEAAPKDDQNEKEPPAQEKNDLAKDNPFAYLIPPQPTEALPSSTPRCPPRDTYENAQAWVLQHLHCERHVPDSSWIESADYCPYHGNGFVLLGVKRGQKQYIYEGMPPEEWQAFKAAPSAGHFVDTRMKDEKYRFSLKSQLSADDDRLTCAQ
jgi:hypothetical protein